MVDMHNRTARTSHFESWCSEPHDLTSLQDLWYREYHDPRARHFGGGTHHSQCNHALPLRDPHAASHPSDADSQSLTVLQSYRKTTYSCVKMFCSFRCVAMTREDVGKFQNAYRPFVRLNSVPRPVPCAVDFAYSPSHVSAFGVDAGQKVNEDDGVT